MTATIQVGSKKRLTLQVEKMSKMSRRRRDAGNVVGEGKKPLGKNNYKKGDSPESKFTVVWEGGVNNHG